MLFRRMGGTPPASNRSIGLALQGGGAHGAFTWGVLDRLLEQPDIGFERISGTSSGAINALALAQGWMDGGREGARACLDSVWTRIAGHTHAAAWIFGTQSKVGQKTAQSLHRYFTPRQINPLGFNPVRQIAEAVHRVQPSCEIEFAGESGADPRNYRVDFTKLVTRFPDYAPEWDVESGARELYDAYLDAGLTLDRFQGTDLIRLNQLKALIEDGELDRELRWVSVLA